MSILIDTSSIIAFLDKSEEHHHFVMQQMGSLKRPFYTCESVLSEAFFLLQKPRRAPQRLLELLESGKISVSFSYSKHASRVREIMQSYMDLPVSFADACLVCMYEMAHTATIFTLDNDFTIYCTSKGNPLSLIIPS